MSSDTHLASDELATPKTDAAKVKYYDSFLCGDRELVPVEFARAQEHRISELESAIQEISELISGFDAMVFDDIAKVLLGTKP